MSFLLVFYYCILSCLFSFYHFLLSSCLLLACFFLFRSPFCWLACLTFEEAGEVFSRKLWGFEMKSTDFFFLRSSGGNLSYAAGKQFSCYRLGCQRRRQAEYFNNALWSSAAKQLLLSTTASFGPSKSGSMRTSTHTGQSLP